MGAEPKGETKNQPESQHMEATYHQRDFNLRYSQSLTKIYTNVSLLCHPLPDQDHCPEVSGQSSSKGRETTGIDSRSIRELLQKFRDANASVLIGIESKGTVLFPF